MKRNLFYIIHILSLLYLAPLIYSQQPCQECTVTPLSGSPFTIGTSNPTAVAYSSALSPDGNLYLAVSNLTSNNISLFLVNPNTCQIQFLSNTPSLLDVPMMLSFSPNGLCLAVTSFGQPGNPLRLGSLTLFSFNPLNGQLTPTNINVPTGGNNPVGVKFSPDGMCLAVANEFSDNVTIFSLNPTSCQITSSTLYPTGPNPVGVSYSPNGQMLAVSNLNIFGIGGGSINLFSTQPGQCSLTLRNTFSSNGNFPTILYFSPNNRFLAVPNSSLLLPAQGNITVFEIDPLTFNNTLVQTIPDNGAPISVAYSPDGNCLSAANIMKGTLDIFSVNQQTGILTSIQDSIPTGLFPRLQAYSPNNQCLAIPNSAFNPLTSIIEGNGSVSIFKTNFVKAPVISGSLRCSFINILGSAQPNTTIIIFSNGIQIGTVISNNIGNFTFSSSFLNDNTYTITAQAQNAAGCLSTISNALTIRIDSSNQSSLVKAIRRKYCTSC